MAENKDHLWKAPEEPAEKIEDLVKGGSHPVGIDVGTSKVVVSRRGGKDVACAAQLNAFIPVPYSPVTERTIQQQSDIHYYRDGDEIIIFGSATERFANMFNAEARRPMADGLLNPKEKQAWPVLEAIVQSLVPEAALLERGARLLRAGRGGRARGAAHLPRGQPAPVLHLARLQGDGHQRGPRRHLLGARGPQLHRHRHLLRRRDVQRHARVPLDPLDHGLAPQGRRLHRPLGGRGGRRARDAREGDQGGGPRPLARARRTRWRRRSTSTTRTSSSRSSTRCAGRSPASEKLPKTERALPIVLAGGTAKPKGFRELFERTLRARPLPDRGGRGARGHGPAHRDRARRATSPPCSRSSVRFRSRVLLALARRGSRGQPGAGRARVVRLLPAGPRPRHPRQALGGLRQEPARGAAPAARRPAPTSRPTGCSSCDYLPQLLPRRVPAASSRTTSAAIEAFNRAEQQGAIKQDAAARRPRAAPRRGAERAGARSRRGGRAARSQRLLARGAGARAAGAPGTSRCPLLAQGGGARQGASTPTRCARCTREQERQRAAQAEALDAAARAPAARAAPRRRRAAARGGQGHRGQGRLRRGARPRARERARARGAPRGRGAHPGLDHARRAPAGPGGGQGALRRRAVRAGARPADRRRGRPRERRGAEACSLARARQVARGPPAAEGAARARSTAWPRAARSCMAAGRFPEAQVALRVACCGSTPATPRARERLAEAERRTGEALFARWLPNQEPTPRALRARRPRCSSPPRFLLQGVATDDRGIQKVEFRVGGQLVGEFVPESTRRRPGAHAPSSPAALPLEPGDELDRGDGHRHRRAHRSSVPFSRATGGCASTRRGSSSRRRSAGRPRPRRASAGARSGAAAQRAAPRASTRTSRARPSSTTTCSTAARSSPRACSSTLHRNSLMITGERRIGKTTFLHHLKRVLADGRGGRVALLPRVRRPAGRARAVASSTRSWPRPSTALELSPRDARRRCASRRERRGLRRPRLQPRPASR